MLTYDFDIDCNSIECNDVDDLGNIKVIYSFFDNGQEINQNRFETLGGFNNARFRMDESELKFFAENQNHLFDNFDCII